jgi:DNA (cytosine-5)-methyltransferase 1
MGTKPRLLDLFCGAGGAAMGYHRAGFEVVGVDIKPQKHYPFEFHQGDAMTWPLDGFDVIHASPPCQAFTALKTMWNAKEHEDLLTPTRLRLIQSGKPYIIENVPGAPIKTPMILCGTMFGLKTDDGRGELRRHRLFDLNWFVGLTPECNHAGPVIGVYGGHGRDRRRTVTVTGHCGGYSRRDGIKLFPIKQRSEAMGIDWMTGDPLSQAIPPAYTEFIGKHLMEYLNGN